MVRSSRLFAGRISAGGNTTLYTVPAGDVALVKSVAVRNAASGSGQFAWGGQAGVGGPSADFYGRGTASPLPGFASDSQIGWWVLNAGDFLYFTLSSGGPFDVWVSGAVLS